MTKKKLKDLRFKDLTKKQKIFYIVFLLVFCLFFARLCSVASSDASTTRNPGKSAFANLCRDLISDQLKSPSTADFENIFDEISKVHGQGNNIYSLYSYVDAQNSFGATLRSPWYCKMKFLGGNDSDINSWKVLNASLLEE